MNPFTLVAAISFPILERIPLFGDAAISPHGIGIAVGFALGARMMMIRAQKRGLGHLYVEDIRGAIEELLLRAALGAIVGARGFYVLTHLSDFEGRWLHVLAAWEGGLTFLGGVVGAILFAIPFARGRGWRMTMLLDSAAPGIALGLAVGRIGDLMIGDHIGAPTDFPLAWRCTGNYWVRATNGFGEVAPLPYPYGAAAPTAGCFDTAVHHTALYDFGATIIVLGILLLMERRRRYDGAFMAAWVYSYGALRFLSDFARSDKQLIAGLTGSQLSLLSAMIVVTILLVRFRPWERDHWAWDLTFDHPWMQAGWTPTDLASTAEDGPALPPTGAPATGGPAPAGQVTTAADPDAPAPSTAESPGTPDGGPRMATRSQRRPGSGA